MLRSIKLLICGLHPSCWDSKSKYKPCHSTSRHFDDAATEESHPYVKRRCFPGGVCRLPLVQQAVDD